MFYAARGAPIRRQPAPAMGVIDDFGAFCDALCQVHFRWGLDRPGEPDFLACIRTQPCDEINLTDVRVDTPLSGSRSPSHIARVNDAYFGVVLMLKGGQRLTQGANEAVLGPHDLSIWDATQPARFQSNGPVRQISVFVPHRKMRLFSPNIEDQCAGRIDGTSGLGLLLASHLRALNQVLPAADLAEQRSICAATLDLIGAAARPRDAGRYRSSIHRVQLRQLQSHIIDNLQDPGLSPTTIARSMQVTARYLHKLFEHSGYTICEWILARRLDACRRALEDPTLNHLTVTEIAFRWGFSSASYFSRAFKQHYGLTPSSCRNQRTG